MRVRELIKMILGPSKKMVQDEYDKNQLTKVIEQDRQERKMIHARLEAIRVSLPVADRNNPRNR